MASRFRFREIADFTGGRNGADDPADLADTEVVEALNGDFHRTTGFRKRSGTSAPSIGSVFGAAIASLLRHTPANNPSLAELWAVDADTPPVVGRMAGGATFSAVTLTDAVASASAAANVRGASANGKFFLAYDSTADRLHVWDPTLDTPRVRRVGLAAPAAPTAADEGSGSYAATIRYYRVRYRIKNGVVVVAQSEPSSALTFTPDGASASARVTKPASISESETHWVLEASDDNTTFYELAETAVATTTYDDSADVATYSDGDISPVEGSYEPPISWKYVTAAFNRLFGLGAWESGQPQSRLWFTPAKGTTTRADDERVVNTTAVKNRRDLDEGTGGDGTGFAGPIFGALYAFKFSQVWKIVPTGVSGNPLDIIDITKVRGAINQEFICEGIDNAGMATVYFGDPQVGPCSLGSAGVTIISDGIRDLWDDINLDATGRVGQCIFYPARGAKGQVWWWWATGNANTPDTLAFYDVATGGWSVAHTDGELPLARAAVLFSRTLGASMSRDLVPYIAHSGDVNEIQRADTGTSDNGATFQAYVRTRKLTLGTGKPFAIATPFLYAPVATGVTITVTFRLDTDDGLVTKSGTVSLTADGSEAHVYRRVENLEFSAADRVRSLEIQIGDAAAVANAWAINRLFLPVSAEDVSP